LTQASRGTTPARPRWLGRRERWFYLLAAPWILGLVALQLLPAMAAAGLAFASWEPPLPARLIGLDNFAALASDARFFRAIVNTAVYGLGTVVPGLAIGLAIALLLAGLRQGGSILRAAVFLPAVVSGVATALMWAWIFNPRFGLLDAILGFFGLEGPAWLRDAAWAMPAMILMGLWNVGVNVVIYTAALATVPRELTEAASLDGAGRAARFRHVTWPALTPVTFYLVIVNAIAAFQVFTPTYLLTGGGPDDATLTTALYTYQTAFDAGQLGYASAMTIGVFAIVVLLTAVQFRFLGRRVTYLGAEA
jgi:multiple sugar transport system permease protein